jgi:hypothetical protein
MLKLKMYGAMMVIGTVAVGVSQADKTMNYIETDAVVKTAKVDCYIKSGKRFVAEKATNRMAYIDCDMAPYAAKEFGHEESAIKERVQFTYSYKSPVDGSMQSGEYEAKDSGTKYRKGTKFKVLAHKDEPGKSRVN